MQTTTHVQTGLHVLGANYEMRNNMQALVVGLKAVHYLENTPSSFPKSAAKAPLFLRKLAELSQSGKGFTCRKDGISN